MVALLLCVLSICSDDMVGRLDNQGLRWSPSTGATYYVVAVHSYAEDGTSVYSECASTNGTTIDLTRTSCYADRLCVKACKPDTINTPPGPDFCSDYNVTEPVEMWPWACVRGFTQHTGPQPRDNWTDTCEERCYQGAPLRLPNLPECPP